jgi:multiple sugar transport system substrate-binding protein
MKQPFKRLAAAIAISASATMAMADVELLHDKGFWADALETVGEAAKENTGTKLVQTPYATPEQYKAFIQTSATSGEMPELFTWWTGGVFSELIESKQVAPMDALWDTMIERVTSTQACATSTQSMVCLTAYHCTCRAG